MIFIKQYGSKRSGTCYVTALLKRNFVDVDVLIHKLGGKHADPIDYHGWRSGPAGLQEAIAHDEVRVAIAVKNPYAWVHSFVKAHRNWSRKFRRRFDENRDQTVRDLCEWWVHQNRQWLAVPVRRKMAIRHEDLLRDFQGTMLAVAQILELQPRVQPFVNITKKMTPNDTIGHRPFDPCYYTEHRYLSDLGGMVPLISKTINWDFAAELNYYPVGGNHGARREPAGGNPAGNVTDDTTLGDSVPPPRQ